MDADRSREHTEHARVGEVWEQLIEATPDVAYILSSDGMFLDVNPKLCTILGQPREQIIGTTLAARLDHDCVAVTERVLKNIVSHRMSEKSTRTFRLEGAVRVTLEVSETPLVRGGQVWAIAGIGRDITQEIILERKLWDSTESRQAAVDFAVRSSLGLVKGYVYTLGQGHSIDDNRRARYVHIIEEEIDRLSKMVEDVLDARRMEMGDYRTGQEIVDIRDCVSRAVALCSAQAQEREIRLKVNVSPTLDPVYTSREAVIRALINLIQNAIQYSVRAGDVTIDVLDEEAYVEFVVKDQGVGILENELPYVFDKYYRAKSSAASPVHGAGLGLTITRTLIEALGGRVWATSTVGAGSEFRIVLPRRPVSTGDVSEAEFHEPAIGLTNTASTF